MHAFNRYKSNFGVGQNLSKFVIIWLSCGKNYVGPFCDSAGSGFRTALVVLVLNQLTQYAKIRVSAIQLLERHF